MNQDEPDFVQHLITCSFLWAQVSFLYMTFRFSMDALWGFGLMILRDEAHGASVIAFILTAFIFWMMGREVNKHANKRMDRLYPKD